MIARCVLAVWLVAAAASSAGDCADSVKIESTWYQVGPTWCGQKIDTSQLANSSKLAPLPDDLTYADYRIYLIPPARDAFVTMAAAARNDGIDLTVDSGFRSISYQRRIIARRLAEGVAIDEIFSSVAPPGYSEHHTGRAVDLVPSEARFAHTDAYAWLKKNAERFGFQESMPEIGDGDRPWESWHWYYSGK